MGSILGLHHNPGSPMQFGENHCAGSGESQSHTSCSDAQESSSDITVLLESKDIFMSCFFGNRTVYPNKFEFFLIQGTFKTI